MKNLKKLTMLASAAVLAIGLTACGKSDYNGTYTGFQVSVPSTATGTNTQQYPSYNYQQQSMSSVVQASLSSNGDTVTGTYSIQQSTGGYQQTTQPTSYQLTANSEDSNSLTNVMLIPSSSVYGGASCPLTGSLASSNGGKSLSGTLSPLSQGNQYGGGYSACQAVQITLNRTN